MCLQDLLQVVLPKGELNICVTEQPSKPGGGGGEPIAFQSVCLFGKIQ